MNDQPEVYIIPSNVTDNGNVVRGLFKKKNAAEAVVVLAIGAVISFLFLSFLGFLVRMGVFIFFALLSAIVVVGIKGESFGEYVLETTLFKKKKRSMKYRLPRKNYEEKKRFGRKSKEEAE